MCRQYNTMAAHAEAALHEESSSYYLDSLYQTSALYKNIKPQPCTENKTMRSSSGDLK
jgi:hypothetical protein